MKMRLKKIRKIDVFIAKKYDSINKSFFGKITIKLIGEIVLACFIACAVYLGSILYSDISATYVENKKLDQISISDKYIEEQFGIPYISFNDTHDLTNRFFMLKDAILRTVSNDNKVIAYFITATNENEEYLSILLKQRRGYLVQQHILI